MNKENRYTKEEVIELCKQAYNDGWKDCDFDRIFQTDIGKDCNQKYKDSDDWCKKNII